MPLTEDLVESVFRTVVLGVVVLLAIIWVNAFFTRRITVRYEVRARGSVARQAYDHVFLSFFLVLILFVLVQVAAIALWAAVAMLFGVVADPVRAVLFAGSCYLTVGFVSDIAPDGWKLLPIFIAVSGIFSFALSTAALINMTPIFRRAWLAKHAAQVRKLLAERGVSLEDLPPDDEIRQVLVAHAGADAAKGAGKR